MTFDWVEELEEIGQIFLIVKVLDQQYQAYWLPVIITTKLSISGPSISVNN
ncbi:MAG: hypothetical protein ACTSXO_07315 [Candidatus Heimdallarchaeota archaeon]